MGNKSETRKQLSLKYANSRGLFSRWCDAIFTWLATLSVSRVGLVNIILTVLLGQLISTGMPDPWHRVNCITYIKHWNGTWVVCSDQRNTLLGKLHCLRSYLISSYGMWYEYERRDFLNDEIAPAPPTTPPFSEFQRSMQVMLINLCMHSTTVLD